MTTSELLPQADNFSVLRAISVELAQPGGETAARDSLVRFLDRYPGRGPELPLVDSLCACVGLYPYMSRTGTTDQSEALAVEYHSPPGLASRGFTFHADQQKVYERLMGGESVILSAPTSFGKSAIMDALVVAERWNNLAIIVPTVALIDEVRRRLVALSTAYTVVSHPTQERSNRNIYILTQERFLELDPEPQVDFFSIDEFYKLDSLESDPTRRAALNIVWRNLRRQGGQYYLTGPHIDGLVDDLDASLRANVLVSRFATVAVEVDDRSEIPEGPEQLDDLVAFVDGVQDESTLVFVGSPAKVAKYAPALARGNSTEFAQSVAKWIGRNYYDDWYVPEALESGVATHTGPMPRSLQRAMVRLFQQRDVPLLMCTSTLIEGVNTVARNVVIFEKRINRVPIDFFTFSNIRGRAGRMSSHFVGRVVTYCSPPDAIATTVDIPIESQAPDAPLAALVQIDDELLTRDSRERLKTVLDQKLLSMDTIRKNRGVDPEVMLVAAQKLHERGVTEFDKFRWTGAPNSSESYETLKFGFDFLLFPSQRVGNNFNMVWGKLQAARESGGDTRAMVAAQMSYKRDGQTDSDVVDDVLRFQRNMMGHAIPSMLRTMQSIYNDISSQRGQGAANYEYLLREIESLYSTQDLMGLEDYGLPFPVAKKLEQLGLRGADLPHLLESLIGLAASPRVRSQLDEVELWFVDDVIAGVG